jgi:hypothetical protein
MLQLMRVEWGRLNLRHGMKEMEENFTNAECGLKDTA